MEQASHGRPSRVWYVAYGSNIDESRFRRYLEGDDTHPGARESTPPARSVFGSAPLRLAFAGESKRWSGGGVAFVTPDPNATAWVRAWDITGEQFEDVFAQENRRPVGSPVPWKQVLTQAATDVGTSWYCRILRLNSADDVPEVDGLAPGQPVLTFTWRSPIVTNRPHRDYRATIAAGLSGHMALSPSALTAYLDAASTLNS